MNADKVVRCPSCNTLQPSCNNYCSRCGKSFVTGAPDKQPSTK